MARPRARLRLLIASLLCAVWLGGCAAGMQPRQALLMSEAPHRLFYIGLGLYSEEWSRNDVVELADQLRQSSNFDVVPLIASNFQDGGDGYPLATPAAMTALVRTAAAQAAPGDVVLLHISTHGGPGVLASRIGDDEPMGLTGRAMARWLEPLSGHPTVIILSACYSGSLIASLRAPQRIIIAAARADRSSFGCSAESRHTFFGTAELHAFQPHGISLRQAFAAIRGDAARMERARRLRPSEPQISIGADMAMLYDAPLF